MKVRLPDALHQEEATPLSVQRCDAMRHSRQDVVSVTHMDKHGVARVMGFDDRRAFQAEENIACVRVPVPIDTLVAHEAQCRHAHVRSHCDMLQAIRAFSVYFLHVRAQFAEPGTVADCPEDPSREIAMLAAGPWLTTSACSEPNTPAAFASAASHPHPA